MIETDMIIIESNGESIKLGDFYSLSHYIPPNDLDLGGSNDVNFLQGGLDNDGHIDVYFYRKLKTSDPFDKKLFPNDLLEICWAYKDPSSHIDRHSDSDIGSAEIVFADHESFLHFKRFGIDSFTKSHARHMAVSWGVSIVIAVIAARYFKWTSWWIYVHVVFGSQVIISTIVSSASQFQYDRIFHVTMHDLQFFSSRLGFFIVALCAAQGIFGFLLIFVRNFTQNFQIIAFVTRAHKVVGWALVALGLASIELGKAFVGSEIAVYYLMVAVLAGFEVFSTLQMYFPWFRFYVRKVRNMSHQEAFDMINQGRLLMFADDLVIDIKHFQYSHPGGKFMISEAVGEDTGKYLTGCSSYGGPFQPYEHSEAAFNLLKYLSIGKVPYPKGYLQGKSESLSQSNMEFLIFKQEKLSANIWLLTLKSPDFFLAEHPLPEWLGKHFKITHQNSTFHKTRRYYSSLFVNLENWAKELEIEYPGTSDCPGAVQIIYKAYEGGAMTQYLQNLPIAWPVQLQGPLGPGLMIDQLKGNYLAFAGGTGLVPFLDLLHLVWINRESLNGFYFILYLFFRNHDESFCVDFLKKVYEKVPQFFLLKLVLTGTRKSFVLENEVEVMSRDDFQKIWLCGPSGMNRRIYSCLDLNGYDKRKIILM
jgi:NAD(P)H-flavin reductase/cytochrome b involved in lipid metabolism